MTDFVDQIHASQDALEVMYLAIGKIGLPIVTVDIESTEILQDHKLPAVILRCENEDIDSRDEYTGGDSTTTMPNGLGGGLNLVHDANGQLQIGKSATEADPVCRDIYIVSQYYSVELIAEHKTGVNLIINEMRYLVQNAIARLSIEGLFYDGSYGLRPGRDESASEHHARILRYVHRVKYDALTTNVNSST